MKNTSIDIHADDYAYSLNTSKDILECMKLGKLNSISIICNTTYFDECMELLYNNIADLPFLPLLSIHLNFPEGEGISDLLPVSWLKLFGYSYSFSRNRIKNMLKQEIKFQIDKTTQAINKCIDIALKNNIEINQKGIRIDSHIHTHHIPVVFDALKEVIKEEKYNVEYIRNAKEPILPFLKHVNLISSYGIANIIKNRILMFYSGKIDRFCDENKIGKMYMWGLTMSGHMDFERIKEVFPDMYKRALKDDRTLELLFHPGKSLETEYSKEMSSDYFKNANLSENRHIEKDSVMTIEEIINHGKH